MAAQNWALMICELRRYPQISYKSDIVVISGLDAGDRKALDSRFKGPDSPPCPPCQFDIEDHRFVLQGACFNPMEVINTLSQERGYTLHGAPQQHNIPLKHGNTDDRIGILYHLVKTTTKKSLPGAVTSTIHASNAISAMNSGKGNETLQLTKPNHSTEPSQKKVDPPLMVDLKLDEPDCLKPMSEDFGKLYS